MIKKILLAIGILVSLSVVSAEIVHSPKLVLTHSELSSLNLSKELILNDRLDMLVQSDIPTSESKADLTTRLNELGWSVSWQRTEQDSESLVTNFYKQGGKHLRLEISDLGNNAYKVLLYQF